MIVKNVSRLALSGVVGDKKSVLAPGETADIPDVLARIWIGRKEAIRETKPEAESDDSNPDKLPLGDDDSGKGDNKEGKKK